MTSQEEAKAKDQMLRYMLVNCKSKSVFGIKKNGFTDNIFYLKVFDKTLKLDMINRLMKNIISHGIVDSFDLGYSNSIVLNDKTKGFIKKGGFLEELERRTEAAISFHNHGTQGARIIKLTEKELSQRVINNKWTIPLAIISIVVLALSILKPSDNVTKEELNNKIEFIQWELRDIEKELKQKNKELKSTNSELLLKYSQLTIDTTKTKVNE